MCLAVLGINNHPKILLLRNTICLDYKRFQSFITGCHYLPSYVPEDFKVLLLSPNVRPSYSHLPSALKIATQPHKFEKSKTDLSKVEGRK